MSAVFVLPLVVVVCTGAVDMPKRQRNARSIKARPHLGQLACGGSKLGSGEAGWVGGLGAEITEAAALLLTELEEVAHAELKNLVPAAGRGAGRQ